MTTAFVLTGGGSLGAVQVGMLQALAAHGIEPDFLVGTSAGAMNAAWVAGHGTSSASLGDLAAVWAGLHRADLFPFRVRLALRGLLGRRPALTSADGLTRLVSSHAAFENLEQARIPVHLITADLITGCTVRLSSGPAVDGVLASAAVPGILPPVLHDGRYLVDGAVAADAGVRQAVDLGATTVYVLPGGTACALRTAPRSAVGVAVHALTLVLEQRLAHEVADLTGAATIRVLPPLCPLRIPATDFSHAPELVARARQASRDWIRSGDIDDRRPARFLSLHDHEGPRS